MTLFHRGILFIYNVYFYEDGDHRKNSEKDVKALTKTFNEMQADIVDLSDDTLDDIKKNRRSLKNDGLSSYQRLLNKMEGISQRDFSGYKYVAIAVLTHGRNDGMIKLYGKNQTCSLEKTFLEPLIKNKSLKQKLKWIIAAPCRGKSKSYEPFSANLDELPFENFQFYLITCSTIEDCVAKRPEDGNIFIQVLCSKLKAMKYHADIHTIFEEVAKSLKKKTSKIINDNQIFQIPTRRDNLFGSFVFFKTNEESPFFVERVWE